MRRKALQDLANTLCHMVVGWRMGDDFERIAQLPDGTLSFDLLKKSATHSSGVSPELWITGELAAWLTARLAAENIDQMKLVEATLDVQHRTDRIKTDRKKIVSFDFECHSVLATDERRYQGKLVERHSYHTRVDA
ncbi:hypothetical protein ACH5Y9_08285 [Methylomonas sp. BW4-1]|uniref:hypothetical protein n=1 Tax=Methylomonas sp. BW4-1 TaxID=3376685 RepID=UPI00404267C3